MTTPPSEKARGIRGSDILATSFWGCLILLLGSTVPLLTILAGILTLKEGLAFWGSALIALGLLAFIGPFHAATKSKDKG